MGQVERSEFPQGQAPGSANALLAEALHFLQQAFQLRTGGDSTGVGLIGRIRALLERESSKGAPVAGLQHYRCHKQVRAAKIVNINHAAALLEIVGGFISVTDDYLTRHTPHIGGYYVVYDDGYQSFSPAAAFEGGYTLLPKPLTFREIPWAGDSPIARKCLACDVTWTAPVDTCPECGKSGQVTLP